MTAISKTLSRLALWLSAIGLVAMTLIICWQVFARYVLGDTPAWAEQASLYLMLWFILFAAAAGVREGFHIKLSLWQDTTSERQAARLRLISNIIVGLFGVAMAYAGAQLVSYTWQHSIPTLGLPRGSAYLPIVGAGLLTLFFSIEHIIAERRGDRVEPLWS